MIAGCGENDSAPLGHSPHHSASLWLGTAFVLVGAINVWLILQASASMGAANASARLVAAHRIGGYLFIALFCVMAYFMVAIPSFCRQGQCGTCKTQLLSGDVRMGAEEGLDPESRSRGFVLTCVGHADGAVRLDA
jgi:hypothetical protein